MFTAHKTGPSHTDRAYAGDETLPYFPLEQHEDSYSRTKAIAEELVLQASTPATKLHRKATRMYGIAVRTPTCRRVTLFVLKPAVVVRCCSC